MSASGTLQGDLARCDGNLRMRMLIAALPARSAREIDHRRINTRVGALQDVVHPEIADELLDAG